jgi:SAM-dependent methyltransferase
MHKLPHDPPELQKIYEARFASVGAYRNSLWQVLTSEYFSRYISAGDVVLDLGCGYGEFINNIRCGKKYGMDLNPHSADHLNPDVRFLEQDCSSTWRIPDDSLDVVFTSNFFEHLPDKYRLSLTLAEAHRCLRPGGTFIGMGPNIKFTGGAYWDFFDHYLALTELSLTEILKIRNFEIRAAIDRFLPYTMVNGPRYPSWMMSVYLKLSVLWPLFGKQFLVIATKP